MPKPLNNKDQALYDELLVMAMPYIDDIADSIKRGDASRNLIHERLVILSCVVYRSAYEKAIKDCAKLVKT